VLVTLAAGTGLRQGEIFDPSMDDIDFERGLIDVRRQVKLSSSNQAHFALSKGRETRTVPTAPSVREQLGEYLSDFPAREVQLPWGRPDGRGESIKTVSERLRHSDPAFTRRVYTHLLPSSESRTKDIVDAAFPALPPHPAARHDDVPSIGPPDLRQQGSGGMIRPPVGRQPTKARCSCPRTGRPGLRRIRA
jgi:hypothetical protein